MKNPNRSGMKAGFKPLLTLFAVAALAIPGAACAAEIEWETDMEAAKKRAADEGKLLLVDFTGSDWCGWCIRLKDEVFTKEEFITYANETFVPVMIDFPRRNPLPEAETAANRALMEQYGVRGFPTILVLDAEGQVVHRTGYRPGGPEAYVAHLKEALAAAAGGSGEAEEPAAN